MIFRMLKTTRALYLSVTIAIFIFLNVSGFISEITGGYYTQLNLENSGIYYDAFYVHKSEIFSSLWLSHVIPKHYTIQSDEVGSNRLFVYGNLYSTNAITPQSIRRYAYVYVDYTNRLGRAAILSVDRSISIAFPLKFLEENKNLIYNNGSSQIYR